MGKNVYTICNLDNTLQFTEISGQNFPQIKDRLGSDVFPRSLTCYKVPVTSFQHSSGVPRLLYDSTAIYTI